MTENKNNTIGTYLIYKKVGLSQCIFQISICPITVFQKPFIKFANFV